MTGGMRLFVGIASVGTVAALASLSAQGPPAATVRQVAYIKASNAQASDHFGCGGVLDGHAGYGAAISGDGKTMAIASPHEDSAAKGINGRQNDNSADESGAVYVFVLDSRGRWVQQAYVKPSNTVEDMEFGHAVVLSADGNTLAVSAFWEPSNATGINGNQADTSIPQAGAAYVFTRTGVTWSQQAYIKASNTGEAGTADTFPDGDQFGVSLAISDDGNTIAVGAFSEDSGATGINGDQADNSVNLSGAVYVFRRGGTTWTQQAYIKPHNTGGGDMFGYALALSANGDTLVTSGYDEDGPSRGIDGESGNQRPNAGAVYVFQRANGIWSQQSYLHPHNSENGDQFGVSLGISDDGNTLLVGSLDEDCLATGVNPPGCDNDFAADISTGAAYVFVRNGPLWSQQAFLKASNTGHHDWFGSRLALSGDGNVAALGASIEDSAGTGINGKQDDDSATDAGAVYLFRRTGATWAQQAYIKGAQNEAYDEFGGSVALSGDGKTLVASAHGDDGNGRGPYANERSKGASESGAIYVFSVN